MIKPQRATSCTPRAKMFSHIGRSGSAIALAMCLMVPSVGASAQDIAAPETGVAVGNLIISPRLRLAVGYDTNANFSSPDEGEEASPEFYVNPAIHWGMLQSTLIDFSGNAAIGWRQYFAGEGQADDASGLEASGTAQLQINPLGPVSIRLQDTLRLSNDAVFTIESQDDVFQIPFSEYGLDYGSGRVLNNTAGAQLRFHPGGDGDERMGFSGHLGVNHYFTRYLERPDSNRQGIGANLNLAWNFLPRSAVFIEASVRRTTYDDPIGEAVTRDEPLSLIDGNQALRQVNSTPLRAGVGLRSLLSQRLSATLRVGYANGFYEDGPNPSRVYGQAQLTAQFRPDHQLRVGYSTNFADSTFGNYVNFHRLAATYNLTPGNLRLSASVFGQVNNYAPVDTDLLNGSSLIESYSDAERRDYPVGLNLDLGVRVGRHFQTGVAYRILANISDFRAEPAAGWAGDPVSGQPNFLKQRIEIYATFRL